MRRVAIAVPMILGLLVPATGGVTAQEEEQSAWNRLSLLLLPYAGVADNPRETRLPVAPMAGMRAMGEIQVQLTPSVTVAPFLGVAGTVLAVNGDGGLEIDYLTTVEGGVKVDVRGQPYAIGFFGRAYPVANQTWDTETRKWVGGESVVFGGGVGLSPRLGRSAFNVEARYRRDRRFPVHQDESFEILLGFPTWIGTR